jgi:hypothetical protein
MGVHPVENPLSRPSPWGALHTSSYIVIVGQVQQSISILNRQHRHCRNELIVAGMVSYSWQIIIVFVSSRQEGKE